MASPVINKNVKPSVRCYHCGDDCGKAPIVAYDRNFCCDGCKLVYELLQENNLCDYYDITKNPGHKAVDEHTHQLFRSLDDDQIRAKLLRFESEGRARVTFLVSGMHCSSCIWLLEHLSRMNAGVISSTVHFPRKEVTIDFDPSLVKLSELAILLSRIGYTPSINLGDLEVKSRKRPSSAYALKIGIAGFCFGNIMMMSFPEYLGLDSFTEMTAGNIKSFFGWLSLVLALPVLIYSASGFFVSAWKTIRHRELNIDAPIALAIAVTFGRSVYEIVTQTGGGYLDSMSGIVFFMLIGRYFQDRSYENLSFDRDYKSYFPIAVSVVRENTEQSVPVNKLKKGDVIRIRNGELIPADSILFSQVAHVDYSFVTGESDAIRRTKGEKIYAGARMAGTAAELQVINETSQSYLTQLWNNDAFSRRKEDQHKSYIDHINRWFSLAVLLIAFTAGAVWFFIDPAVSFDALTAVLIVVCPCTLLLSATFTNANILKWLSRSGLYLKNAHTIERIAKSDMIVFDKTGTITSGKDADVVYSGEELNAAEKRMIAALTSQSGHPLSRRLTAFLKDEEELPSVTLVNEVHGKGLTGVVNGVHVSAGSASWLGSEETQGQGAEVWIAFQGKIKGHFNVRNKYREGFEHVAKELSSQYHLALLSGDKDTERERLAPVFRDQMFFRQQPQDKLDFIRGAQSKGYKVVMIGDGLNDAGALMQADAGIAVSDDMNNYFPACDAILDAKSFDQLPHLIRFAKAALRIVKATFVVSLFYNAFGIYYAVTGQMSPMIAAILMPASTFSVILITTISSRISARNLRKTSNN